MAIVEQPITAVRIAETDRLIRAHIRTTPVVAADGSDFGIPIDRVLFKLESMQHAGSFKARGAFTSLLSRPLPAAGVVAASGGNHGLAVAYAAHKLGVRAAIFVPSVASPVKIETIRRYGADLHIVGDLYADALEASRAWAAESGALSVHAYDSADTLLGQGTLGLELDQQVPALDTILVAVGGGGLIGGLAGYFSQRIASQRMKVVGVEPAAAPTLTHALRAGHPVDSPAGGIAADSLAPKRVGELNFTIAQQSVSQVVLVSDEEIGAAQAALWDRLRVVSEPGGAAAFAALLSGHYQPHQSERLAVIVCGGNTTAVRFEAPVAAR
ncbi:MAG TPA: threonine/serine dehydratase [Vicinamibacterales bacterium]